MKGRSIYEKVYFCVFVFFCLSFTINIVPSMATSQVVKQGIYSIDQLNLSPNTKYTVQNNSFNDRVYIIVFDSKPNIIQAIRLRPQSKKYNLKPFENGYTILVIGNGEIDIS